MSLPLTPKQEKVRAYNRVYRQKNKESLRARSKQYHEQNRDRLLEAARKRYEENKEQGRARARKWHGENRDRALAKMREWDKNNGNKRLGRTREQRYGISPQDYETMFAAQGRCCAICGCASPKAKHGWHVDHDHSSGKVRAILCHNCNCGLGHAKESPETLQKMIEYLRQHSVGA